MTALGGEEAVESLEGPQQRRDTTRFGDPVKQIHDGRRLLVFKTPG